MKKISIDPITRLEGHGRIDMFLNDKGELANAYFIVPELRGFEKFCEGRPVEELMVLTPRICGVCPTSHHLASAKAADAVYHCEIPSVAKKLRELMNSAYYVADHTTHFYALGGPDFVVGPDAPKAERNILGVIKKVGLEIGGKVIRQRAICHEVVSMLGGKYVHPSAATVGGMGKGLSEEERKKCQEIAEESVEFGKFSLKVFGDIVLSNKAYVDLITSDAYTIKTYYMGLVDDKNKVNFYEGKIRVVDPGGKEFSKFEAKDYLNHIVESVEPWTYLKFPYLKSVGWKGLVDGKDSGVYRVAPLARLNAADGMATPLAQEEYQKMYETLGGKPVHFTLANHWARLVELLYAAEKFLELCKDPEITDPNTRVIPTAKPDEGIGVVEAPRGTLIHHYQTDEKGVTQKVNLIVATINNHAAISLSIKKAAAGLIKGGKEVSDGILNMIEMAFRAYDPCFGCATHFLPGEMPMEIKIFDSNRKLVNIIKRD